MKLRPYQADLVARIKQAWLTVRNVLAVQATRTGKTVVFASIMADEPYPSVALAHRRNLVEQTSLSLAYAGVAHRIIAPADTIKRIRKLHVAKTGRCYHDPQSLRAVASVDTLVRRGPRLREWTASIRLWVVDEAHHVTGDNKWARVVAMFPNARGLGVTATPCRADGKGLGRHAGGVFDTMIEGLQARDAIAEGWLLPHTIYAPHSDYHRPSGTDVGANGDFKLEAVRESIRESQIVGDVVDHYRRIVPGKRAVVFASDVATGEEIAAKFRGSGVGAELVCAKTPVDERERAMHRFDSGSLSVLVNVDLFGEGTDLPDLDVVIMARPTESFALFAQQGARASTPSVPGGLHHDRDTRLAQIAASAKPRAIIIDHVGNVTRHASVVYAGGVPMIDLAHGVWTLDARDKKARDKPRDVIPLRYCLNETCMQVYERALPACPYCGTEPVPANRSAPEFVDGDLTELDPMVLAGLMSAVAAVDLPAAEYAAQLSAKQCPEIGIRAHVKRHELQQQAQAVLREAIAVWAGGQRALGRSDREIHRRFWFAHGITVVEAKALPTREAEELTRLIAV